MTSSVKSTALESDPSLDGAAPGLVQRFVRAMPVYGLVVLTVALAVLFSLLLPQSFPTLFNLRAILSDKSVIALLALAATIPMITGKIDLTVGYGIVLWHILAISLQTRYGLPWPLAVAIVIACAAAFGVVNGLLVELAQIDSFIATLGTGTVIYAVALWHSGGRQVVGELPDGFVAIAGGNFLGLPIGAFYVLAVALALWLVTEFTPLGRALYVIGANPKAAQLNGISVRKHVLGAFVASGLLSGFAGVLLASRLQIGQASVGLEFLLPALVGAFLGSTTIRPGRVNVWGTLVGVAILAIGISGIQQFGGAFFVEPLFNGLTLLVSIGIAGWAQQRRNLSIKRRIAERQLAAEAAPHPPEDSRRHAMKPLRTRITTALLALCAAGLAGQALADDFLDAAKKKAEAATMPQDHWDGPTSGPKAAGARTIVFVAADMKNGGIVGVSKGVEEAGKAIGWTVRVIDGQGSVSGRTAALNQALAINPAGIVVGGFDTTEQKVAFANAAKSGIPLVGWHAGPKPGPDTGAGLFANVTTTADDVADVAASWAVADSGGKAGVVIFTDSQYAIAVYKARAMEAVIKKCGGCTVLSFEDSPIAESSTRMPQLTSSLLQRFGDKWTYSLAINDLYFDFMGPTLAAAGKKGDGTPKAVSAGDGSEAAYERIRAKRFQAGTVPEPLNMQGWQIVDELNRAFAKQAWSGYVPKVHLVTPGNVGKDGGPKNLFDPDNGYRNEYKKIWGK